MFREDTWSKGFYIDNHDKYLCLECGNSFIIGRKLMEMAGRKLPICPYCGSGLTENTAGTDDERLEELADELGCLGIYIDFDNATGKILGGL